MVQILTVIRQKSMDKKNIFFPIKINQAYNTYEIITKINLFFFQTSRMNQINAIIQTCSLFHIFNDYIVVPNGESIYESIKEITLNMNSTIQSAMWLYKVESTFFKPIYTAEGLCYTFNSINSQDIYTDV